MQKIGGFLMVFLFLALAVEANDFKVQKDASIDGYYNIIFYGNIKDIDGKEHKVPGGAELVSREQLISKLKQEWGNGEGIDEKIVSLIQKVDAEPKPAQRPSTAQMPPKPELCDAKRIYGSNPYMLDTRRPIDVQRGKPIEHSYRFTFCRKEKDVDGQEFLVAGQTESMSKEQLQIQKADLEKNLNSPLSQVHDPNTMEGWKSDLASINAYLNKINELELNPSKEEYIKNKLELTPTGLSEKELSNTIDSNTGRPAMEKYFSGKLKNNGDRTIVNVEIAISIVDKTGKKLAEQIFAVPTDSDMLNYKSIDERTHTYTNDPIPGDTFAFEPNATKDFKFRLGVGLNPDWSVEAHISSVVFKEELEQLNRGT